MGFPRHLEQETAYSTDTSTLVELRLVASTRLCSLNFDMKSRTPSSLVLACLLLLLGSSPASASPAPDSEVDPSLTCSGLPGGYSPVELPSSQASNLAAYSLSSYVAQASQDGSLGSCTPVRVGWLRGRRSLRRPEVLEVLAASSQVGLPSRPAELPGQLQGERTRGRCLPPPP